MTPAQIYFLIVENNCDSIQLQDYSSNRLHELNELTAQAAAVQLEKALPNFVGYGKIRVIGKKGGTSTPWTKGYTWHLEFPAQTEQVSKTVAAPVQNGISAEMYVGMMKDMFQQQLDLQTKLLDAKLAMQVNDPSKWIPVMSMAGQMLGLGPAQIQGPQTHESKTELHFQDIDVNKLSADEIGKMLNDKLNSMAGKISGSQLLKIIIPLEANPNLPAQADKIGLLLNAIIKNPALLETAMQFIK